MLFSNRQRSRRKTNQKRQIRKTDYQSLESRNLLAITSLFDGGVLTVGLGESGDSAVVTVVDNFINVEGQQVDADAETAGVQPLQADSVVHLNFIGASGLDDLEATVSGDFNSGNLASVGFNNINVAMMNGQYVVGDINGDFVGQDSAFLANGILVVDGDVNFSSSSATMVRMFTEGNDFRGQINIETNGDVAIRDINDIELGALQLGSNLNVQSDNGDISNVGNISVNGVTSLEANNVELGASTLVDLSVMVTNVTGHFDLVEADRVSWGASSEMGSSHVSAEFLSQGRFSDVNVLGRAEFDVLNLRLGVGGQNTFNTGSMNINAAGNAFVYENSSIQLYGNNSATGLDLIARGDLLNAPGASINVQAIAAFQATRNIDIGNAESDIFNANSIRFWGGEVSINEDSDMVIGGLSNFAGSLVATADGTITDTDNAYIVIEENARFVSSASDPEGTEGITIGDTPDDFFIAGTISFDVQNGTFDLREDSSTQIDGRDGFVNQAEFAVIRSTGSITNKVDTEVAVERNASFHGTSITLGRRTDDTFNVGSATFNTDGNVTFTEDGGTLLGGQTFVGGDMDLESGGDIQDSQSSFITINGQASFSGNEIILGDLPGAASGETDVDNFTVGTIHFDATGDVDITENSSIMLAAETMNRGNNVRLSSVGDILGVGDIQNANGASLMASGDLRLHAVGNINLDSTNDEVFNFDNLNFHANENVDITAIFADVADEFFIFGNGTGRNLAAQFRLNTNVDVKDGTSAEIEIDEFMQIEARNITLGDSNDDCLMIPVDAIFVTDDLDPQVTPDADC